MPATRTDTIEILNSDGSPGGRLARDKYDAVKKVLLDVIQRDAVTPVEWARLSGHEKMFEKTPVTSATSPCPAAVGRVARSFLRRDEAAGGCLGCSVGVSFRRTAVVDFAPRAACRSRASA